MHERCGDPMIITVRQIVLDRIRTKGHQRDVFRRAAVLFGCIHLLGGPYGVLQLVAWTGMLASYSASDGLVGGISKTFDGEHPCSLCVAIDEAKEKKQEQEPFIVACAKLSSMELTLLPDLTLPSPKVTDHLSVGFSDQAALRSQLVQGPPSPPPRHLA